jgi:ATP-dependent Clp protease ATP-binding subunit ClpA
MFERFTDRSRQVVVTAQEEARNLQHNYIGTEHILLGLLVADGIAATALDQLGITRDVVVDDVIQIVGRGKDSPSGHIPFTPRAKKVLELALREALKLKNNYIGTEHILLALVREGEGVAAQILAGRLKDIESVRTTVATLLLGGEPHEKSAAGARKKTAAADEAFSAAEAIAGAAPVGSHHLLEALVRAEGSMAAKVLAELGLDADVIAAKIEELDPDTTTDATPEEAAARKMELRLEEGALHLIFRDDKTVELAGRVTEQTGNPITGTGQVAGAFVPLWTATNDVLTTFLKTLEQEDEPEGRSKLAQILRSRLQRRFRRPSGED